jgi:membrane protease YdiL (CAAX protease family)
MVSVQQEIDAINLLDLSFKTIISGLFFTLIQGATGEETGWRGYLLPAVEKKFGVVKGSILVSLIWSLWHAPIWFLNTGYSGITLIKYIIVFIICITCLGFIIGICYDRCKNLFIPIFIHFTFNFLGVLFRGDLIDLVTWYAVFYFIAAAGFFIWYKRSHITREKTAA